MATNSNLKKMLLEKLFDTLLLGAIIVPISTTIVNNLLDNKEHLKNINENINSCYKIIEITNKKIEYNKVNERATFGKYQQEINSLKGEYRILYIKNYKKNINLIQNNIKKLSNDNEKTKSKLLELEKRQKKLQNDINNNYKEIREILENKIKN